MRRAYKTTPATRATTEISIAARPSCRHCDAEQPMALIGYHPLLYCGKDVATYQCRGCGHTDSAMVTT